MKKVLMFVLSLALLCSLSLTVLAEPGAFVESPSGHRAPRLISFSVDAEECQANLVITAYADRNMLDTESKAEIEEAYNDIKSTKDLTTLTEALAQLAAERNIDASVLAVSDLFDMDYTNCNHEEHKNEHGYFTVKLQSDTFRNFVGLLHSDDGSWEVISDATLEGDTLTFKVKDFSPFAVVVDTTDYTPDTGETSYVWLWAVLAGVSVVACVLLAVMAKKSKTNK